MKDGIKINGMKISNNLSGNWKLDGTLETAHQVDLRNLYQKI